MASSVVETCCCVVGGGPAGMMLAYLLARKGIEVTVLEKHENFYPRLFAATPCTLHARSASANLACSRSSPIAPSAG